MNMSLRQNPRNPRSPRKPRYVVMAMWSCAVLLLTAPGVLGGAGDWNQWRGPNGDGISQESGWRTDFAESGPPVLWDRQVGIGYSSVVVQDAKVFTAGWAEGQDTVYCFDAASGEEKWTRTYAAERYNKMHEGGPGATPAVDADRLYMIGRSAKLYCLSARDGGVLWTKRLRRQFGLTIPEWGFTGSPVVSGEKLYVDVGRILAFDKISGELRWKTENYGAAYSTPTLFTQGAHQMVAAFPAFGLVILDAATGQERAKHRWKTNYGVNAATPIVEGNRVFISSGYNTGAALLELGQSDLEVRWEEGHMRNHMATCVLVDGYLYGFDESVLRCIDFESGKKKWKQAGLGKGSLMAADGKLIILSEDGELIIADATPNGFKQHTRQRVFKTKSNWTVPVLAAGKIYCRSSLGQLVCLDVGASQ